MTDRLVPSKKEGQDLIESWEGGYSLIQAIKVHAAPTGRVFGPFWSEKVHTAHFGMESGIHDFHNGENQARNLVRAV